MTEIKIHESRYLSLIESETFVPRLIKGFVQHLVNEWKKDNLYRTEEERKEVYGYVRTALDNVGIETEVYFNNTYNCMLMFRYKGEDYFITVAKIDTITGLATG